MVDAAFELGAPALTVAVETFGSDLGGLLVGGVGVATLYLGYRTMKAVGRFVGHSDVYAVEDEEDATDIPVE